MKSSRRSRQRLDLTELEVRNVISYYSMLTTKPRGKFNVQVCTNISCMVRGGEDILHHCAKKLGIGHKQTTPDGLFTLEEVECIGACSWAPAAQVNYDFHENLTHGEDGQDSRRVQEKVRMSLSDCVIGSMRTSAFNHSMIQSPMTQ